MQAAVQTALIAGLRQDRSTFLSNVTAQEGQAESVP